MFRSLSLSVVLVALVACEEEPMDAALDTGWAEAARGDEPAGDALAAADADLGLAGATAMSVRCGTEANGYTNATDEKRCVNVQLTQECKKGAGGSARTQSGGWLPVPAGGGLDISVPAGESLSLYCGGVQGGTGCCEFVVDRALGACTEG